MSDREWFASVEISTQSCDFIIEAVPWHHLPYEFWWSGRTLLGVRNIVNVGSVLLRTHNPQSSDCACSVNIVMPDGTLFEAARVKIGDAPLGSLMRLHLADTSGDAAALCVRLRAKEWVDTPPAERIRRAGRMILRGLPIDDECRRLEVREWLDRAGLNPSNYCKEAAVEAAWYELERRGLVPDDLISRPDLARGGPYVVWRVQ